MKFSVFNNMVAAFSSIENEVYSLAESVEALTYCNGHVEEVSYISKTLYSSRLHVESSTVFLI
jgi:hypothetical protein